MFIWRLVLTAMIMAAGGLAYAQNAPAEDAGTPGAAPVAEASQPADEDAAETADEATAEAAPEASASPAATGDVITLNDGKVISGVQVVRATPSIVSIQIVPGVEPLDMPRKMVESIAYDNLRPEDVTLGTQDATQTEGGGGQGEISLTLANNLAKPVTDTPLPLTDRDVVEVLEEFAARLEVGLEILPEVRQMPAARRLWNTTIPAGMAFTTLLREKLPADFPMLEAEFTFERVQLKRKPPEGNAAVPGNPPPQP